MFVSFPIGNQNDIFASNVKETLDTIISSQKDNAFEYPSDEEWKKFETHKEMTDFCQIPTDLLKSMSKDELIDIAMDYPLLMDMYLFNDYEEGFNTNVT